MVIKYSLALIALPAMVVHGSDGGENVTLSPSLIHYKLPGDSKTTSKSIFTLSAESPLTIKTPTPPQGVVSLVLLGQGIRKFYDGCNTCLDLRALEFSIDQMSYQPRYPCSSLISHLSPTTRREAILTQMKIASPVDMFDDFCIINTPETNKFLPVHSLLGRKEGHFQLISEVINALINPGISDDGKQFIDLTILIPKIQAELSI